MFHQGRVVKLGPGHYRIVHNKVRTKSIAVVDIKSRDPNRNYCECGKPLNKNNKMGVCTGCVRSLKRKDWPVPNQESN